MSLNKKQLYTIINFILLIVLAYFIYYQYNKPHNLDNFDNSNFSKICTMNLRDIDHRAINEYTNFDGRKATCGKCEGATIKMNISTCATDENGSPLPNCVTNANVDKVTTINNVVYNDNVVYPSKVNVNNIKTFFCLE